MKSTLLTMDENIISLCLYRCPIWLFRLRDAIYLEDMKTAQSVFYLRNHVLTMLLFLSKMIYVVSDQNHNLLLCSEKDLRNSQLGKFGILPTWGNHKASPKDQRPVFSSTNCEEPWTAVLHPQLHQQDIRPSSNLRELPPTLVSCLNTAATQPYPHLQKHQGH